MTKPSLCIRNSFDRGQCLGEIPYVLRNNTLEYNITDHSFTPVNNETTYEVDSINVSMWWGNKLSNNTGQWEADILPLRNEHGNKPYGIDQFSGVPWNLNNNEEKAMSNLTHQNNKTWWRPILIYRNLRCRFKHSHNSCSSFPSFHPLCNDDYFSGT